MSDEIKCIACKSNIKTSKKVGIEFIPQLTREEKKAEINYLIDNQNYDNIHSCVCIDCIDEYIKLMKQKLNLEKDKHDNCIISIKDLLLDISNQDKINEIMNSVLNEQEVMDLKNRNNLLKKERIELENKISENKTESLMLRNEEENLCLKINKIVKEKEENNEYLKKLELKLKYLKNEYNNLMKNE